MFFRRLRAALFHMRYYKISYFILQELFYRRRNQLISAVLILVLVVASGIAIVSVTFPLNVFVPVVVVEPI